MPIDYSTYPKDWEEIRARILDRAGNRCEWCRVPNHTEVMRYKEPAWIAQWELEGIAHDGKGEVVPMPICSPDKLRLVYIVLTIAHLDWNPSHNGDTNLAALCQQCHLRYDAQHNAEIRRTNRRKKKYANQLRLWEEEV